jgi:carbon-monoxide dehydrogenase medium subunit
VSLAGVAELRGVTAAPGGALTIGAMTTHAVVAEATREVFPALSGLAGRIGDPAVRNRGTIGGSLANNDPAACYPAAALACGAVIRTTARQIAADDYFRGLFETALAEGELITAVTFPIPAQAAYRKFVQPASRFALVGVFVARFPHGTRVAVTGASDNGVFRWQEAERALSADFSVASAASVVLPSAGLAGDIHATAAYRAHLAGVLLRRATAVA